MTSLNTKLHLKPQLSSHIKRVVVLCFLLSLCSCSSTNKKNPVADPGKAYRGSLLREQLARSDSGMNKVPEYAEGYYNFMLGELALKENSLEEALDHFEEASELENEPATALRKRLAQLYLQQGEIKDAEEELAAGLTDEVDDNEYLQLYAGILANQKKYPEAVSLYRRIIKNAPAAEEYTLILIANTYEQQGDLPGARTVLNELIGKKSSSVFGHYYRARVNEALGEAVTARADYKKAIALGGSTGVRYDYARFLAGQNDMVEAKEILTALIASNPSDLKSRGLMAKMLLKENKVDEALEEFEQLSVREDDPSETRLKIAIIKIEKGDFAGAEAELRLILGENEDNEAARYYLGSTLAKLSRAEESVDVLMEIEDPSPYFSPARVLAAVMLKNIGQNKKGAKALAPALEGPRAPLKHLSFLASLQKDAGDVDAASETLERIIARDPDNPNHHFTLGVFLDQAGETEKGEESIRKAIALNPKNADALNYLGYAMADRGDDLEDALDLIKRAVELQPNSGYFIDSLGWVYYKMGRLDEAYTQLGRAAKLVPSDAVILEHYAIVQNATGRKREALQTLFRAREFSSESSEEGVEERIEKLIEKLETEFDSSR